MHKKATLRLVSGEYDLFICSNKKTFYKYKTNKISYLKEKITLFFLFILITSFSQNTDTGSLQGRVTDSTGTGIPYASLTIKTLNTGDYTDEKGHFHIKNIPSGTYFIAIQAIGYQTGDYTIDIKKNEPTIRHFRLSEEPAQLDIVVLQADHPRTQSDKLKETGFHVNAIEISQYQNTTTDLNQVLNKSMGVRIRESGGTGSDFNFSINGLSGKQIKYFIDGVPLDVFGDAVTLNNIPVNLAERLEVYKGVVPVQLGSDAMGGAVNIITNQKIDRFLDASYSFSSFNTHKAALSGQYTHKATGLTLRANAFCNYSDNNYIMKNVEVWDEEAYAMVEKNFRRFHDQHRSAMVQTEVGVKNKKWADHFSIGGAYSGSDQEIQTGYRQELVFGRVTRKMTGYSSLIRYRKDNLLNKKLHLNFFASRSLSHTLVTDTSKVKYRWDGSYMSAHAVEQDGSARLSHIIRPKTFARANINYNLLPGHTLNLNYTLDHTRNEMYNAVLTDKDDIPGIMGKHITGIAYQSELFHRALMVQVFGKYYGMDMTQKEWDNEDRIYFRKNNFISNYGYGLASRLRIAVNGGIKFSYEHAYRLQEIEEVFGNGLQYQPNPDLKPEYSDNFNMGIYYRLSRNKHLYYLEAAGFIRDAHDFIYLSAKERNNAFMYENKGNVKVTGAEGEVKYSYDNLLSASVNATWQNTVNHTRYAANGKEEATYLNKIPNTPWFFFNTDLSIGKNNIWKEGTRLQFNWYSQFVHWFYLTWEAYGDVRGKAKIPGQYVHSVSLSYSLDNGKYNFSIECRNLTNALAYDNFRLQKPGRAFSAKIRYFIH